MLHSRRFHAVGAIALLLILGLSWTACRRSADQNVSTSSAKAQRYHCPMHPTYISDKPGDCPICGMALVPMKESPAGADATAAPPAAAGPAAPSTGRTIAYYRSPMDASVHADKPAKDSMGMDFVPVYQDEIGSSAGVVSGRAVVSLSPERRSMLGLHTEAVEQRHLENVIRTVGRVTPDERLLYHIHTKYEGYVERLFVDFTGKPVQKGDALLSIYSPELVATQQEYLLALRAKRQLASSEIAAVAQGGANLLDAARERLLRWDVRPQDIQELEQRGTVKRTIDLYSEVSGIVAQKNVYQGMRVMPADTLFDIADLSHLWVLADVYTSDLPSIRVGMQAEVSITFIPGKVWRGPVTWIAPTVEEKTRTIKVRIEVDNRSDDLKPDMFTDVILRADLGAGLVVPDSAVIDAGDRHIVFLDQADGRLEPREVLLGAKLPQGYQVLKGLAKGDRVVTPANFLLDSESSLKAALSAMTAAPVTPGYEKK
jgi:RND family efflux transporter MFP subunit